MYGHVDVQSFIDYKTSKEKTSKSISTKKGGQRKDRESVDEEVIVSIVLMVWDTDEEVLREKRGKRQGLHVTKSANVKGPLEKVEDKWKHFHKFISKRKGIHSAFTSWTGSHIFARVEQGIFLVREVQGRVNERLQTNHILSL